ncbi:MAG: S-layer homology domain-containing protein [Candidatus Peribacteraceae bacterium]|nr:S-layer homology domain-containing protein [Candidatus Peribacteraceae bacterium]
MRKTLVIFAASLTFSSALAFSDVGENDAHKDAIDYIESHSVVSGFPDREFKSERSITRAELAKIVVGARGEDPSPRQYNSCFSDVANEWFAPFVCFAKEMIWIDGYADGTFRPGETVNRAEAAKIILNTLGVALDDSANFPEISKLAWFAPFANTIRSRNLFDGTTFAAGQRITRGEVAEMIYRVLIVKNSGAAKFSSALATNFDEAIAPDEIVRGSIDFPSVGNASFALSSWRIEGGVWTLKPALDLNNRTYYFNSPQNYVAVLAVLQKHFAVLGVELFDEDLTRFISEFEAIIASYRGSDASSSILPSGENSTLGVGANFSDIDITNEAAVAATGAPFAEYGNTKIYAGYEILTPLNYNPLLVSFTNGSQNWLRRDYETSSDESLAQGILWADANTLFVIFTSRGVEENINTDFRRFTQNGWLSEYGEGSGKQVAVIARIDPTNGDILAATFLSARLSGGETNSLNVTAFKMDGENLVVSADAWEAPRRINGQPMDLYPNAENAPYSYEIEFTPDLKTAVRAEAPGYGQ